MQKIINKLVEILTSTIKIPAVVLVPVTRAARNRR